MDTDNSNYKFCCKECNYKTIRKTQYDRHLNTVKHKLRLEPCEIRLVGAPFTCKCGKVYKHQSTLCAHKKQCIHQNKPSTNNISIIIEEFDHDNIELSQDDIDNDKQSDHSINGDDDEPPFFAFQEDEPQNTFVSNNSINVEDNESQISETMLYKLFEMFFAKISQTIGETISESINESTKELKQTIMDQQVTIQELANRPSIVNNTNNTNNGTITTNIFLNVNCKDAMTFESYLNEIKVEPAHIWLMMKEGSCAGFCEVMKSSMTNIKLTDRPIHCTDAKRDSHWVKYSTGWVKEHENQSIKRVCSRIKHRSGQTVMDIINADPEYKIINTDKHEKMIQLMTAANGTNVSGGQDAIDATIIKYADEKVINLTKEKMMQAIKNDMP